jgi:hypothetical protein
LINTRNQEAIQLFGHFYYEIKNIIKTNIKDSGRIERLLDNMLSFCYDEEILLQYKKLLRYYYPIDPEGTTFYVKAYMDMYNDYEDNA